jgi:BirA family transcriptional regulator, biotin operon repressor / biotin---[acetyl-CoA-carboxylase] ligase
MYQRLFIGKKTIKLDEVDSTNNFLQQLILNNKNEIEGLVVVAKNQYSGKGLGSNSWQSEKNKNLTFSILLKLNILIKNQFIISKVISLGVLDFLNDLGINDVKIKWPNDIYVADKKIGGILIENSVRNNKIYNSIVGVGLNVNQINFDSITNSPTSIFNETGKEYLPLNELLNQLLFFIEKRYLLIKADNFDTINKDYLNNLYWYNEIRSFQIKGEKIVGFIIGIRPNGKIQLKINDKIEEFDLKEIRFLN